MKQKCVNVSSTSQVSFFFRNYKTSIHCFFSHRTAAVEASHHFGCSICSHTGTDPWPGILIIHCQAIIIKHFIADVVPATEQAAMQASRSLSLSSSLQLSKSFDTDLSRSTLLSSTTSVNVF